MRIGRSRNWTGALLTTLFRFRWSVLSARPHSTRHGTVRCGLAWQTDGHSNPCMLKGPKSKTAWALASCVIGKNQGLWIFELTSFQQGSIHLPAKLPRHIPRFSSFCPVHFVIGQVLDIPTDTWRSDSPTSFPGLLMPRKSAVCCRPK